MSGQQTKRKWYPGTDGNPFDQALQFLEVVERTPAAVLGAALALGAAGLGWGLRALGAPPDAALAAAVTLAAGIAADWMLLAALPRAGRSFGPVHPQLVMLAVLRALVNFGLGLTTLLGMPGGAAVALAALAQLAGTALAVRGFWHEPQRLSVTRHTIRTPKLSADSPPLRVLHLADIHMERTTAREREVLRQARELQPDLIVFSGDFLNLSHLQDPEAHAHLRDLLRELRAPLGVYAVSGSPAVDRPEILPDLLAGLDLRWLRDERVTVGVDGRAVEVIGLSCTHVPEIDAPRLQRLVDGRDPQRERFTLLLYHTPDLAPEAARLGLDLQLSGHTHGGQVRLPLYGAIIAGSLYGKRFEMGLRDLEGMRLFVSRGLGLEGKGAPRVRFLCPPEIALFEIMGEGPRR